MTKTEMIQVDYFNFMDALEISDKHGDRLRVSDQQRFPEYCLEHRIDVAPIESTGAQIRRPKLAVIEKGLMEGIYLYSLDDAVCYRYVEFDKSIRPLEVPEATSSYEFRYDVTLSYARPQRDRVLKLQSGLEGADINAFWIDVDDDPDDPVWPIRFRQGMFYSRFMLLFLTDDYLRGEGATWEVFDAARLSLRRRQECFFYPMILLVDDFDRLVSMDWSQKSEKNPLLRDLDYDAFEWIRNHVFPVPLERGGDWLQRFVTSLVQNDAGTFDPEFLHCLEPDITALQLQSFSAGEIAAADIDVPAGALSFDGSLRTATVFLKHPWLTNYTLMINSGGQTTRFMGVHEPGLDAFTPDAFGDPVEALVDHLCGSDVQPSKSPLMQVHSRCLPQLPLLKLGDESVNVELNPTATRLLTRFGHRPASVYSVDDGSQLCETPFAVDVAAFNPRGNRFAAGTRSGLFVFEESGDEIAAADVPDGVTLLAWCPTGNRIALGTFLTGNVQIVDAANLLPLLEIDSKELCPQSTSPLRTLFHLAFSPSGEHLAAAGIAGLAVWRGADQSVAAIETSCCYHAAYSPSGQFLAASFSDGTLRVYPTGDFREQQRFKFSGPVMQTLWLSEDVLFTRHRTRSNGPHVAALSRLGRSDSIQLNEELVEGPASIASEAGLLLLTDDTQITLKPISELL